MRKTAMTALGLLAFVWSVAPADANTILGFKFDFKEKPGFPTTRRMNVKSKELLSPDVLTGDPATNGATVQVILLGGTSTSQTITLPSGSRWRRSPSDPMVPAVRWRYKESRSLGFVSPINKLELSSKGAGTTFKLVAQLYGKYVPLNVAVPNPGTYAGLVVTLGGGGTYCTNFGGAAGGSFTRNDAVYFRVSRPTAEGTCPSGAPVCGDNVVDAPFETCDGTSDAACPGLCGSNGLPCLCPFCGDATIDPGESCDTQASLGACTEGCSYQCTCTTCGNGIVETPAEGCEPGGVYQCSEGTCGTPGNPDQCECPYCGDLYVNLPAEQCDGTDDSACPGQCLYNCICPVCGNNEVEGTEECDGTDDSACTGNCLPTCVCAVCGNDVTEGTEVCDGIDDSACPGNCLNDCTCAVCGNETTEGSEQCDGTDDAACPGLCQVDCTCP